MKSVAAGLGCACRPNLYAFGDGSVSERRQPSVEQPDLGRPLAAVDDVHPDRQDLALDGSADLGDPPSLVVEADQPPPSLG